MTQKSAELVETDPHLIEAADGYLESLIAYVDLVPGYEQKLSLDTIEGDLRNALDGHVPNAELESIISDARTKVDRAYATRENAGNVQASRVLRTALGSVRYSLDILLFSGDAAALRAAEVDLAEAEDALERTRSQMEVAINQGDVDQVLSLRTSFELELPAAVERARVVVLEHRLARAEALLGIPIRRSEEVDKRMGELRDDFTAANLAVAQLQADYEAAQTESLMASSAAGRAKGEVGMLRRELDDAVTAAAIDAETRLRSLAGLPPKSQERTAEGAAGPTIIRPHRSVEEHNFGDQVLIEVM